MAADDRVIVSFWDTSSVTWTDFRITTFNTSTNAYVYSNTAASSVQSCNIVDTLYTPKKATIRILNRPEKPFSDNAATAGTQGPWSGKVGQFTRIKIMDGVSKQIYFIGFAFDIQDDFNILTIKAYDDLNELRDLTTAGKPDFRIEPGRSDVTRFTSLPIGSGVDSATNQFTDYLGSRSGIIKSIINLYSNNITAENSDSSDTRFKDSAASYNFAPFQSAYLTITNLNVTGGINDSVDNFVVDDSSQLNKENLLIQLDNERMKIKSVNTGSHTLTVERGADNTTPASHTDNTAIKAISGNVDIYKMTKAESPTSLLTNIQNLAVEDPHKDALAINSGTGGQTYGYDYYVESNITSTILTTPPVPSFFHYFKKGDRPTTAPTSDSDGLFNQGLNIHVPNPTSTANGEFSETGRLIACTEYDVTRPQDEVYTEAAVSYNDISTERTEKANKFVKEPKTDTFQLVQIGNVVNPNDVPGVFAPLGSEVTTYGGKGDRNGYFNGVVSDKGTASDPKNANGAVGGLIGSGRDPSIDGDGTDNGGKSPEWLKVRLTSLTGDGSGASGIDHNDTTLDVVSTAGMYVGQKLQIGVQGTLGTAVAAASGTATIDFNPKYSDTWSWGSQAVFAANDKILVHGVSGTEEMTIASIDTSAGTLGVTGRNATSANENAAVAHESGALVETFPEIVTVTAVSSATQITVTRNSTDSRAVNRNWDGNTNTEIYAWKVARPQMLSLTEVGNVNGAGIPATAETCDLLISHLDPNIAKGTSSTTYANKFDTYWKVNAYSSSSWSGSSKTWIGQDSLSSFELTYAPQNTYEYRRSVNVNLNDIDSPTTTRERILAILQRKTHQVLRTTLNTYRPPRYYFDDIVQSVNATAQNQTINLSSSTVPAIEGLFIGCVVNVLSNGAPTGVYGYIDDMDSDEVDITWNSGSGVSAGATLRYYVPVRAGDMIKHRNDPANIDQFMRVTKVTYDENNGVALTRYHVVGAQSSKEGADAKMSFAPPFYKGGGEEEFMRTDVPFEARDNMLGFAFSVTDADTVAWAGGDFYVGQRRYVIDAGNTGNMTVGTTYIIYYYPGQSTFLTTDQDTYLRLKKSSLGDNIMKIATAFSVSAADGKAYFRLEPSVSSPEARDIANAPDIINTNSLTATLQKKGNQGWATDIIFEGTDWDDIKWHKVGSSDSTNANVSFSDGTNEAITYGTKTFSGSELNKTIYAYKAVGDSASATIVFTTDYTALYQDDRILLATFVTAASDDGTDSPSIFPFQGSQPTISAGLISAGAIVADNIQANAITATKISSNAVTADKINANAVTAAKIAADAVTADKINANAVTAAKLESTLTVSNTIRTASSGARVELTSSGIKIVNAPASAGTVLKFVDTSDDNFGHFQATTYNSQHTLGVYAPGASNHTLYQVANFGKEIGYSGDAEFVANGSIEIHDLGEGDDPSELYFTNGSVQGSLYISGSNLYLKDSSGGALGNVGADFRWGDGSASTPTYSFSSDPNTGIYRVAADNLGFGAGGYLAGYIYASSASNGYFYAYGGFTFAGNTNNFISHNTTGIRFNTGSSGGSSTETLLLGANDVDITSSSGTSATAVNTKMLSPAYVGGTFYAGSVRPYSDNALDIGGAINRWDDVYATNSTIQTSDLRQKENINDTKLGLDFIKDLRPVSYDWKDKKENKINQTHYGLIAQEVLESLKKHGIDSIEDFGGISHDGDPEHFYGARYGEFVPILIKAVQELKTEIDKLKENK